MERYTTFCTPEQTKKALELGAPINVRWDYDENNPTPFSKECSIEFRCFAEIPTAEQMISWLRTNGLRFKINESEDMTTWQIKDGWRYRGECTTPKEATLAAIDAALEYLSENKKVVWNTQ